MTRNGDQVQIAIGSSDKLVRFWDIETGEQIGAIDILKEGDKKVFGGGVDDLAFNSDWTLIATAGNDVIQLWSAKP